MDQQQQQQQQQPRLSRHARLAAAMFLAHGLFSGSGGPPCATALSPSAPAPAMGTRLFATARQRSPSSGIARARRRRPGVPQRTVGEDDDAHDADRFYYHNQQQQQQQQRREEDRYKYKYSYNYNYEEDEDEDDGVLSFEVDSFQELQRSTGYEVLDDELQSQIDEASPTPNTFLDAHVTDASFLEKVAMSSVPEQLPQPAVHAFRQQQQQQQKQKQQKQKQQKQTKKRAGGQRSDLEFSSARSVSPEEEIELAKMIQRGVWLHKLKTDQEASDGRSLSKSEWAKLANLETPTMLRREVATYRRAKQLLVSANMGLVHTVVKKNYYDVRKRSGVTYEELVQEGSLGLLRAAELFDPSRGIRFSTYATIWIKGHLSNSHALDGAIKLPAAEKQKWKKITKAHRELVREKGGTPGENSDLAASPVSVEELASRLDMKVEDVLVSQRKMKQARSVLSLDYEYQQQSRSGTEGGPSSSVEEQRSLRADADLAERAQMQADVIASMARNLTPREARLMRLRYGLTTDGKTRTIKECADAMGVSQARASQLAKACLAKLREAAEADSLEEYLLTIA